jgi:hypothetical protein
MLILSSAPKSLRYPRTVLSLGFAFLVLALVWPKLADTADLSMSADSRDTVHGFLYGVSFGLLFLWLFVRTRKRG